MSGNCNVTAVFPIFGQFGAIQKLDSGCIVCKTYNFTNLLSYKNWKQNYKFFNTALTLLLWVNVLFLPKKCWYIAKNADISKLKRALIKKLYFLKLRMCVYLRTKILSCSITATNFTPSTPLPHTSKRTPKKPTQIRIKRVWKWLIFEINFLKVNWSGQNFISETPNLLCITYQEIQQELLQKLNVNEHVIRGSFTKRLKRYYQIKYLRRVRLTLRKTKNWHNESDAK